MRERRLKITQHPTRNLVTVIELLSPWNKDAGATVYDLKRDEFLAEPVNFVEIDLLIGGQRPKLEHRPPGHYYVTIARAERRPEGEVYAWTVRDALPRIPIPLRPPDADIQLDLGAVFRQAYKLGRYADHLYYEEPLTVSLKRSDLTWARKLATAFVKKREQRRN